jgi:hypothetical protein
MGFRNVGLGSRPAYRREPVAGPLCGLQRSKHARTSGLSRISVVLIPGSEGQNLAQELTWESSTQLTPRGERYHATITYDCDNKPLDIQAKET